MEWEFSGPVWFWKGPAPWYFVTVPDHVGADLQASAAALSYGWGMIPVSVRIGRTEWTTSLWPKDETYVVPVKAAVRQAEKIVEDDVVTLQLAIAV